MGKSVSTHVPAHCQQRRASEGAKEAQIYLALEGVNANVASAPATLRETPGCTARRVNATAAAVKAWTARSVGATARVPVVAACVREAGSGRSASTRGSVT